jgi:acyl-CoA synthetase (AMP-forming)/AMP-acid ligase II
VVWNHRNELFGIRAKTHALGISAADRVSLLRANSVGAARDMHLGLLNGAAVVTLDSQQSGLASLASWLRDQEISVFSCVASVFRQAVESARSAADFAGIRLVHIGGEPILKSDVELYKRYFPDGCRFVSRYSISETQAVSYFFIDKKTVLTEERVPVGYAIDGGEVAIVDDDGHEVDSGVTGEIVIRSPYLALGYWRRPKLTRAKFAADATCSGVRSYRTGDLGYRLSDGCLVHVGRKDLQVKIRGHRVELGAVETALHGCDAVKQAVVVAAEASFNAEQFRFQKGLGQRRAIDRHEGMRRSGTVEVQRLGDELFAGAALALNEHVHGARSDLIDQPNDRLGAMAHANDILGGKSADQLGRWIGTTLQVLCLEFRCDRRRFDDVGEPRRQSGENLCVALRENSAFFVGRLADAHDSAVEAMQGHGQQGPCSIACFDIDFFIK